MHICVIIILARKPARCARQQLSLAPSLPSWAAAAPPSRPPDPIPAPARCGELGGGVSGWCRVKPDPSIRNSK
eukprot:scaffold10537_cov122-Isochrysis_galbana.AAC.7